MTSLAVLTDAEAALVGGGAITQTISISVLERIISTSQTAIATNAGCVSATAVASAIATAVPAEKSGNGALVLPVNVVEVLNSLRLKLKR